MTCLQSSTKKNQVITLNNQEQYGEIVELKVKQGLTNKEISEKLKIPEYRLSKLVSEAKEIGLISDEDIQLLRDMAAREFLLNLQTVTPTANISFGDVRETADVNKIIDVLQDMVDEQLATNLVVN